MLLRYKKLDIWADAVNLIIPWGFAAVIALFIFLSVKVLAGHITFAQIGMSFLGDIRLPNGLAYAFGGGGVLYGMNERRLRHKKTSRMAEYTKTLEERWDKSRTSSGLTPRGTTGKGDRR